MRKVRTTVTLTEDTLRWVKVQAARLGKGDSEVIEEALLRDRGDDVWERLWRRNRDLGAMDEDEAMKLALEAQRWARRQVAAERREGKR
jgi:hypothetical protein